MGDAISVADIVIDGVGSLGNVFDQVRRSYPLGAPPKQKKICVVGAGAIGGLARPNCRAGEEVTSSTRAPTSPRLEEWPQTPAGRRQGRYRQNQGRQQGDRSRQAGYRRACGEGAFPRSRLFATSISPLARPTVHRAEWFAVVVDFQLAGGEHDQISGCKASTSGALRPNTSIRFASSAAWSTLPRLRPRRALIITSKVIRFLIGELDRKNTPRVKELHDVFIKAGLNPWRCRISFRNPAEGMGQSLFQPDPAPPMRHWSADRQFAETLELAART